MKPGFTLLCLFSGLFSFGQAYKTTYDVSLVKEIPFKGLAGKEYEISVDVKSSSADSAGGARILKLEVGKTDYDYIPSSRIQTPADPKNTGWQTLRFPGRAAADAQKVWVYLWTVGNGDFYFDNIRLRIKNASGWEDLPVPGGDFEKVTPQNPVAGLKNSEPLKRMPGVHTDILQTDDPARQKVLHIHTEGAVPDKRIVYGNNPAAGHYHSVNGCRIYYETYGSGEPLLLLHGNGGSIFSFTGQIAELAKTHRVIAVDTRGQGNSIDTVTRHFSYDLFAEDMKNLLDGLGLKRVDLLGWSDGGNTGLILASKYPAYVNHLILMGANLNPSDSAVSKKILTQTAKDIRSIQAQNNPKETVTLRLLEMLLREPNITPDQLKKITAKTLVLAGEHDLILEKHTRFIAACIPGAELQILQGQDHFVPEKNPMLFNKTVVEFLGK